MEPAIPAVGLSIGLFVALIACLEVGFRIGRRDTKKVPEAAHEGIGAIEAAVFALLGLLLGFTFAGGISRLDGRRLLIVQEANAIGTAYLRLDMLPANEQTEMRRLFRTYLDARLRFYDRLADRAEAERELENVAQLQQTIWSRAATASQADPSQNIARLLLPALNEMIDVTTSRTIALRVHTPVLILFLLSCVALLSGLLAGYAMAKRRSRSWFHALVYAAVVAVTIYAVLDLDRPRSGLIRVDAADAALRQLRNSIR